MNKKSMANITFTYDLEEHLANRVGEPRYPDITHKVLDFLSEKNIQGTFFVVGNVAKAHPELIKEIAVQGHEIGFHSMQHKQLNRETPESFKSDLQQGKAVLEDLTGEKVHGYRAPVFSLTKETVWAVDVLKEQGFTYSSSILPAKSPLHGFEGAPNTPFKWSNDLIEIPVPIASFAGFKMPYLGGFYLRYLPLPLIKHLIKSDSDQQLTQQLWTYIHPYDFDHTEPYGKIAGASTPVSILLWFNRKNTFSKLEKLFGSTDSSKSLNKLVQQVNRNDLRTFKTL